MLITIVTVLLLVFTGYIIKSITKPRKYPPGKYFHCSQGNVFNYKKIKNNSTVKIETSFVIRLSSRHVTMFKVQNRWHVTVFIFIITKAIITSLAVDDKSDFWVGIVEWMARAQLALDVSIILHTSYIYTSINHFTQIVTIKKEAIGIIPSNNILKA